MTSISFKVKGTLTVPSSVKKKRYAYCNGYIWWYAKDAMPTDVDLIISTLGYWFLSLSLSPSSIGWNLHSQS